jgi:hypothetical protein
MTKKQKIEIAVMWSAAMIHNAGTDSFDTNISEKNAGEIVDNCQKIAAALLNGRPLMNQLPDIINYCTK